MARSIHCILLALAASPLLAADAPWRGYAVYQPTIERAVVCDAADQPLRYNHDSSVAWFGDRWFCLWNANAIPEEGEPGQLNYVSTSHDGLTWSAPRPAFSDPGLCVNPVPCLKGTQWQPNLLVVKDQLWCLWSQNSKDEHNGCYLSVLATPGGLWTNRLLTWNGKADPVIDGKAFRLFPTQSPVQLSTGRVLALEFLVNTPAVAHCIREGKTYMLPGIMQTGKNVGMITMDESLRRLYVEGVIARDEVLFRADDKVQMTEFLRS